MLTNVVRVLIKVGKIFLISKAKGAFLTFINKSTLPTTATKY